MLTLIYLLTYRLFTDISLFHLRTPTQRVKTRVFGLLGLRRGLSRLWSGHPRVTVEQRNVLSLFHLCVAPGWFDGEGFALAEAYTYHGLFTYFWTDRIYTRYRCHVQGFASCFPPPPSSFLYLSLRDSEPL